MRLAGAVIIIEEDVGGGGEEAADEKGGGTEMSVRKNERASSPVKKGTSSVRVLSGPSAKAIVSTFFIAFNRRCTSSFLSSSMRIAIG